MRGFKIIQFELCRYHCNVSKHDAMEHPTTISHLMDLEGRSNITCWLASGLRAKGGTCHFYLPSFVLQIRLLLQRTLKIFLRKGITRM